MPHPPHPTASRAEAASVLRQKSRRSIPLFLPAIYEHKAWLIRSTPSAISRDAHLLTRALLTEFEQIGPDALTVGVDVYNVEAEAVGCVVTYYDGADTSIPGIRPGDHLLRVGDDLSEAYIPNPNNDGRMPINLRAASNVRRVLGDRYWIRGALSGPFSLAVSLVGAEALFIACIEQPAWVHQVLAYSNRIILTFAKAYIDVGVELILFDSQASPALLSPAMYEEFVLPATREIVQWARTQGIPDLPLIIGGDTTPIIEHLIATGANNLLCDYSADFDAWTPSCIAQGRSFRRNLSPRLIEKSTPEKIYESAVQEIRRGHNYNGFIMGTAVIPFATPTENILAVKQGCQDAARPDYAARH